MVKPRKILVIEDSDLHVKMMDMILKSYEGTGTRILHAANGREAITRLCDDPDVDLILLDINMPVMSGLEFLDYRKREGVFEEIPVIIISTEGDDEDIFRGLEAGACGYLTKPFRADELYTIVKRVLFEMMNPVAGS